MTISVGLLASSFYVMTHVDCRWLFHMLTLISGVSVIVNSPIDSNNKKLDDDEISRYRRTTCLLVITTMVLYSILVILNLNRYAVCLSISLVLVAILQLPCVVKRRK